MPNYGGTPNQSSRPEDVFMVPIGTTLGWAGTASSPIPVGWLLCDGAAYLQSAQLALFSVIGQTHGNGTTTTNGVASGILSGGFNVPDHRGRFQRGIDNMFGPSGARNLDDVLTNGRFAPAAGGTASGVGSKQNQQLQGHWHQLFISIQIAGLNNGAFAQGVNINYSPSIIGKDLATDPSFGTIQTSNENRPVNSAVVMIIKAF